MSSDWRQRARCAGADPELFFPEEGVNAQAAKGICRACPVQVECLNYALANREQFGVFGGLTRIERRPLVQRKTAQCGTRAGYQRHGRDNEKPCEDCIQANRAYCRINDRKRRRVAA